MSEQKVVVITGASRGLGLVLAGEFASNGWQVVGTGRSEQPADLPANVTYRQFNAGDAAASESFWQQLHGEYPDAEICLVNNAGGYVSGGLLDAKPEDYAQQMNSIYFSAVYMTRGLAAVIPESKIINIISSSALAAHKNNSAYGAAKAAEMHFFQSLQREFKPEQYQITNLYPSDIASHGPNPEAIDPNDLAEFVRDLAEAEKTYFLRDVTLYPKKPK
jgi:NAD(P)-dependent dehydrogenase (short-subunit alcohol dehydrogenase family)